MRLWAPLLALAACGGYTQSPPDARADSDMRGRLVDAEIDHWESRIGTRLRCREESATLVWQTAPAGEVSRRCVTSMALDGCFRYRPDAVPEITLAEAVRTDRQLLKVEMHELRHWGAQCSLVDMTGDPEHDNPSLDWGPLL